MIACTDRRGGGPYDADNVIPILISFLSHALLRIYTTAEILVTCLHLFYHHNYLIILMS